MPHGEEYEKKSKAAVASMAPAGGLTSARLSDRATYWSIHRALHDGQPQGVVCGDIGCYSLVF